MINPQYYVIKAFYDALQGVEVNTTPVPVYSMPPLGELGNYIVVTEPVSTELGCKDLIGHTASINIEVIHQDSGNITSPIVAQEITSLVMNQLKPTSKSVINIENFDMITLVLVNSIDGSDLFDSNRSYRTILTYEFIIDELKVTEWILENGVWNDNGIWIDTATWNDN